jgi:calcineurin-like phosphoesterase family protein
MLHYPMLSWDALHHGGIHLYGHSHGRYEGELDKIFPGRRSMDVGVDNIFRLFGMWRPISLGEVINLLKVEEQEDRLPGPFEEENENVHSVR